MTQEEKNKPYMAMILGKRSETEMRQGSVTEIRNYTFLRHYDNRSTKQQSAMTT